MSTDKRLAYSSTTAFLEHLRVLRNTAASTEADQQSLARITALLAELPATDREALESGASDSASRRRRERAEQKLMRLLVERGALAT